MADHALDRRRALFEGALQRVDLLVYGLHAQLRIDAAVEIDNLAFGGLAHPHMVHVAQRAAVGGEFRERDLDRLHALGRRLAAAGAVRLQRFDVGIDFHAGA